MKTCFRSSQLYILDRDRYPDEGKKEGKTKMAEKAKDTTAVVKVKKLPENWDSLSLEEKYRLVNKKLHKLADIDNDWDIDTQMPWLKLEYWGVWLVPKKVEAIAASENLRSAAGS